MTTVPPAGPRNHLSTPASNPAGVADRAPGEQADRRQPTHSQPAHRPPPQQRSSGWLVVLTVVAVCITVIGFVKPAWAPRLALICLICAAGFAAATWLASVVGNTTVEQREIELEDAPDSSAASTSPLAISEMADPHAAAGLSRRGLQYVRFIGSERIWEAHRLNLTHQPHWPQIRQRVSPELWQALNYQLRPTNRIESEAQLNRLLTEIESI